jgi:transposase InsO family protein
MLFLRKIGCVVLVKPGSKLELIIPPKNILFSSRPLKLLHMDLFGPIAYISIGGNKYGLVIVDDFSCFTWAFFLKDKSEAKGIVKKFLRRVQNEFELKVKNIRSDNESEFRNTLVEELLDEEGIKHELSTPYTPQQNGIVERKNRTLIEAAKTMLDEYKTPDSFWAEAINTACHAANCRYLHKYLNKTPYEIITDKKLSVHYLRVFGCKCFILNKKPKASKFASKVDEGFLIGYGTKEHAYRVFNKTTGCVETTVDVKFDESNGSQRDKVSENLVDDEEPPSVSIFRMGTGEVMAREVQVQALVDTSNQDPPSSTRVESQSSQVHLKVIKKKVKFMVTIMDGALIKRENKAVKPKKKLHKLKMMMMDPFNINLKDHTQEYIKWFNGIIPLTKYLGTFKEG